MESVPQRQPIIDPIRTTLRIVNDVKSLKRVLLISYVGQEEQDHIKSKPSTVPSNANVELHET